MEVEIAQDLYFIERGYLNGNHFAYLGSEPVLIDTGYRGDLASTINILTDLGLDLSSVSKIVSTHNHCDHIGANHYIQSLSSCEIWLHRIGKYFIDTRDDWSTWWRYFRQEADFFECTRGLDDGDRVWAGPHEFEVIHTPGHASDGMALYLREKKILISSDALWERDLPVLNLRVEGNAALFQWETTLSRLEGLDVEMVFPGHGRPFVSLADAIAKTRKKLGTYKRDRKRIGSDLIKRILVFTLMMKRGMSEKSLFPWLMEAGWFKETVDLFFEGRYEIQYHEILQGLIKRGVCRLEDGVFYATVKP